MVTIIPSYHPANPRQTSSEEKRTMLLQKVLFQTAQTTAGPNIANALRISHLERSSTGTSIFLVPREDADCFVNSTETPESRALVLCCSTKVPVVRYRSSSVSFSLQSFLSHCSNKAASCGVGSISLSRSARETRPIGGWNGPEEGNAGVIGDGMSGEVGTRPGEGGTRCSPPLATGEMGELDEMLPSGISLRTSNNRRCICI